MYHRIVISLLIISVIETTKSSDCPVQTTCTCIKNTIRGYDVLCPNSYESEIQISFAFDNKKELQIDCQLKANFMNYLNLTYISMRAELSNVYNLDSLAFTRCNLPTNITLGDIMQELYINDAKKVIMSYSNLTNVKRDKLQGIEKVENLKIIANYIKQFPEDLIYDLNYLKTLDISRNDVIIPRLFFNKSNTLREIEMAQNNLPENTTGMFDNLKELEFLNMWSMDIEKLDSKIFQSLRNLESLDLSNNRLFELPKEIFSKNNKLKTLSLKRNSFEVLPKGLFEFNTNLKEVTLNENVYLTTVPENLFANLSRLETVSIAYTKISKFPENTFYGSQDLIELDLSLNQINELPENLFRDQRNLEKLNLQRNKIEKLPQNIFKNLARLRVLNLNDNKIILSRYDFQGLYALNTLSMRNNGLKRIHQSIFNSMEKLENLDFSQNELTFSEDSWSDSFGRTSPIDLKYLKALNLSHNNISEMFIDWKITKLELVTLDLSYNHFENIDYNDLDFLQRNTVHINLTHNNIKTIDLSKAELNIMSNPGKINPDSPTKVDLTHNPLHCGCNLYEFYRYCDLTMDPNVRTSLYIETNNQKCTTPEMMTHITVEEIKSAPFVCDITVDTRLCGNDSVGCYFQPSSKTFITDYSYSKLTEAPKLSDQLKGNGINKIEVLLRGNNITKMPTKDMGYEKCTVLDMSENKINKIEWLPEKLVELLLNDNNITRLNSHALNLFNKTQLKNITLYNNPFICDCDTVNLTKYLQDNFKRIHHLHNITCDKTDRELALLTRSELCPLPLDVIIILSCVMAVVCSLIALGIFLYYRYNMELKVWLYAHQYCLCCIQEEEIDKDKIFDAFISYSHKDENFIISELIENLEKGPRPYKLCLHFRNWQPGEFITKNIAKSVAESRRTIIILSPNFLQSEWGKMEFRTAHQEALSEKRARVIVILYGDIPMDDLDTELKAYLNTNTYLKWGDPWFWDKLRYALPHSKFNKFPLEKIKIGEDTKFKNSPLEKIIITDDKLDLINEPTTPPIGTTPPCDKVHFDPMIKDGALNVTLVNGTLINNAINSGKFIENR